MARSASVVVSKNIMSKGEKDCLLAKQENDEEEDFQIYDGMKKKEEKKGVNAVTTFDMVRLLVVIISTVFVALFVVHKRRLERFDGEKNDGCGKVTENFLAPAIERAESVSSTAEDSDTDSTKGSDGSADSGQESSSSTDGDKLVLEATRKYHEALAVAQAHVEAERVKTDLKFNDIYVLEAIAAAKLGVERTMRPFNDFPEATRKYRQAQAIKRVTQDFTEKLAIAQAKIKERLEDFNNRFVLDAKRTYHENLAAARAHVEQVKQVFYERGAWSSAKYDEAVAAAEAQVEQVETYFKDESILWVYG